MSIISDALKKAREGRVPDIRPPLVPPPSPSPLSGGMGLRDSKPTAPAGRRSAVWRGTSFFSVFLLVVFAGSLCVPFAVKLVAKEKHGVNSPSSGPVTMRGQFSIEERPVFLGSDKPTFLLSGIAQFQETFMAVVNGHILKQGDEIGGATVVAISTDAVELEYRGERIVLEKTF